MKQLKKLLGKSVEELPVSDNEIANLVDIVERDINDAQVKAISNDRRFTAAYNAALQLCTIIIRKSGYRIKGRGHHYNTFRAAGIILGSKYNDLITYFNACRNKRNKAEYDYVLHISDTELDELISEVIKFKKQIKEKINIE